jgi:DNA-binding response OmpR family regulator
LHSRRGCKPIVAAVAFVIVCKARWQDAGDPARIGAHERNQTKILVVDDDLRLRQLLERYLSDQGFTVKAVPDAQGMDRALERELYDLIVLDLMLPGEDGLAICRRLRGAANPVSIIMLTAKGDEVDRIVGLEIGADDYLPKPFNPRELVARIHAVLRRQAAPPPPGAGHHRRKRQLRQGEDQPGNA